MAAVKSSRTISGSQGSHKFFYIYEFGSYKVNTRTRLLTCHGKSVTIPPKALETLLVLLEHAGTLVSKEEILRAVWPDTSVEDGSLSQSIFTLRKALGESASEHRYILTSVGKGYTFIAHVTAREESESFWQSPALGTGPSRRWWAAALGLATLVGTGAWYLFRGGLETDPPVATPFTSMFGGEYEPAFSPDGEHLAFVWNGERQDNFDIYVSPVRRLDPRRLTTSPAGEASPAWSPDGRRIAFLRTSASAPEAGVFIVPAEGGPEERVADFTPLGHVADRHLHWSPAGGLLAVADRESAGSQFSIYLIDLPTNRRRRLTTPPLTSLGDTGPVFSPDGKRLAFRRAQSAALNDIYVVDVAGEEPKRITFDNRFIASHDWTPDGKELIFSSNRGGPQSLWRVSASGGRPHGRLPFGEDSYFLAVSRTGLLAYSRLATDSDIWRLDLHEGPGDDETAEKLISSTRQDASPQYSPDRRNIAFRSDRSGHDEIWICGEEERTPRQLTSFGGPLTGSPRWSPDGLWIAFDSRPEGNSDIYVIPLVGGATRRVTTNRADDVVPSFSRDGQWIYFASNRTGEWQVWKIAARERASDAQAWQVTRNGGFAGFESLDGKYFYYAKGKEVPGLWRIPIEGGEEIEAIPDYKPGYWGQWGLTAEGIYFLDPAPTESAGAYLNLFRFATGGITPLVKLRKRPIFGDAGFSISADGQRILYSSLDKDGADIMLVRNFR